MKNWTEIGLSKNVHELSLDGMRWTQLHQISNKRSKKIIPPYAKHLFNVINYEIYIATKPTIHTNKSPKERHFEVLPLSKVAIRDSNPIQGLPCHPCKVYPRHSL